MDVSLKLAVDFETYQIGNWDDPTNIKINTKVYAVGLLPIYQSSLLKEDDIIVYTIKDTDEPLDLLFKYLFKQYIKETTIELYFFNAKYDFEYIIDYLQRVLIYKYKHLKYNIQRCSGNRHWLTCTIDIHKQLHITVKCLWIFNKNISLKAVGDEIGIPKLDLGEDYCKWNLTKDTYINEFGKLVNINWDKEIQYLKRDVYITSHYYWKVQQLKENIIGVLLDYTKNKNNWIYDEEQLLNTSTISSLSYKCIQNILGEDGPDFRCIQDEEQYLTIDNSFLGGYTSFNNSISRCDSEDEKIYCYDINSMYPNIMTQPLPYGELYLEKPQKPYLTWYLINITKHKLKDKYKIFSTDLFPDFSLVPLESGSGSSFSIFCLKEYVELLDCICDSEFIVKEIYYQETTTILSNWYKTLYNLRLETKSKLLDNNINKLEKERLKIYESSLKLLLNSSYGKFCEKRYKGLDNWNFKTCSWEPDNDFEDYLSRLTGLFVVITGRIQIIKAIKDIIDAGHTFLYADTDSVIFKQENNKSIPLLIDNKKLGYFKKEGQYTTYLSLKQKKKYLLFNKNTYPNNLKFACGGVVKKQLSKLSLENLINFFDIENETTIIKGKLVSVHAKKGPSFIRIYRTDITINKGAKNKRILNFSHD